MRAGFDSRRPERSEVGEKENLFTFARELKRLSFSLLRDETCTAPVRRETPSRRTKQWMGFVLSAKAILVCNIFNFNSAPPMCNKGRIIRVKKKKL